MHWSNGTQDIMFDRLLERAMMKPTMLFLILLFLLGGCAQSDFDQPKNTSSPSGLNEDATGGSDDDDGNNNELQPFEPPGTRGDDEEPAEPIDFTTVGVPCEPGPTCPGAEQPQWSLLDFQPMSQRFGDHYGLEEFNGTVTLVSLHAAWCAYCRTQALYMDQMWQELLAEGLEVQFVTINKDNAAEENYRDWMIYQHDQEGNRLYDEEGNSLFRCTFLFFKTPPKMESGGYTAETKMTFISTTPTEPWRFTCLRAEISARVFRPTPVTPT